MIVRSLELQNFRNYRKLTMEFDEGINILYGDNAQGKTNILEAVYFCSVSRSHRASRDKECILLGEEEAHIKCLTERRGLSDRIDIHLKKNHNKGIALNGMPLRRASELFGTLYVVLFSPEDMSIIKRGPSERRRFMDLSLSQENKPYYVALSKYNYLLAQRNKLMKSSDFAEFSQTAFIWETQMADAAADIIIKRRAFIEKIGKISDEYHRRIAGENEDIALLYEPCAEGADKEKIKENLLAKYEESHEKDYELGYTTVGVHREDFNITSKGIDLRKFGSQGQQRTAALVIKLAEIEYYYSESGEKPVLLLDDVLSELDERRRTALLEATKGTQALITCTEFNESVTAYHKIEINKGSLVNRESVTQK